MIEEKLDVVSTTSSTTGSTAKIIPITTVTVTTPVSLNRSEPKVCESTRSSTSSWYEIFKYFFKY